MQNELVVLRPFKPADAAAVASACQDPDISKFTFMQAKMSVELAERWIKGRTEAWSKGLASFAITTPASDVVTGQVGIGLDWELNRAEAFYWLAAQARGQGLASAALDLVTAWAFEDRAMVRVQLLTHPANVASQRVAERSGYTLEGTLRAWGPFKGEQPDVMMWSKLESD